MVCPGRCGRAPDRAMFATANFIGVSSDLVPSMLQGISPHAHTRRISFSTACCKIRSAWTTAFASFGTKSTAFRMGTPSLSHMAFFEGTLLELPPRYYMHNLPISSPSSVVDNCEFPSARITDATLSNNGQRSEMGPGDTPTTP